jgi:hypothetical protein
MDASSTILLGIFSSLVATAIFLLCSWVFSLIVVPWIRDQVYRGARVDGRWRYVHPNGTTYELDFTQSGDQVTGEGRLSTPAEGGSSTNTTFKLSGYIADGSVMTISRPIHKYSISHSTLLLRLRETPHEEYLKGRMTVFDDDTNQVVTYELDMKRSST